MIDLSTFSIDQAKFLLKVIDSPNHMSVATGKSEGSIAKQVKNHGYIEPYGKIKRQIRWRLVKPISPEEVKRLREFVKET